MEPHFAGDRRLPAFPGVASPQAADGAGAAKAAKEAKAIKRSDKREKKRQEKREERDRLLLERQLQDDERMTRSRKLYSQSLLRVLPLQPPAVYPSVVDPRNGVYVPEESIADLLLPDCPKSQAAEDRARTFLGAAAGQERSLLTLLAKETARLQDALAEPDGFSPLDAEIARGVRLWRVRACVAAGVALAAVSAARHVPWVPAVEDGRCSAAAIRIQKCWRHRGRAAGHGVLVSWVPAGSAFSEELIEMAFFAFGELRRKVVRFEEGTATFWYECRSDAETALAKMNGRLWKGHTLTVTPV